jgi:hypothetical protein
LKTKILTQPCVILAGSGRSGTTWLGSILDSYEKAEYFYEITNFPELDFGQPDLLRVKYPLTHRWSSRPDWAARADRMLLAVRAKWGPDEAGARRSLRIFPDHRFHKERPDVLLYKIVTLFGFAQRRRELAARFGGRLKVVHLIRNPYAQIASELRIDARDPAASRAHFRDRIAQILDDTNLSAYHTLAREALGRGWVFQMALVWRVSNEVMIEDEFLDKKLVVYERLCAQPLAVVSDTYSYLGWRMSEQTVRYVESTSSVSPNEAETGHFSLRKNAEESLNRWHAELDERTYAEASEAIASSVLMGLWSNEELGFSRQASRRGAVAKDASGMGRPTS